MNSLWSKVPLDIIKEMMNYFTDVSQIAKFCKDYYINSICGNGFNTFWKDLLNHKYPYSIKDNSDRFDPNNPEAFSLVHKFIGYKEGPNKNKPIFHWKMGLFLLGKRMGPRENNVLFSLGECFHLREGWSAYCYPRKIDNLLIPSYTNYGLFPLKGKPLNLIKSDNGCPLRIFEIEFLEIKRKMLMNIRKNRKIRRFCRFKNKKMLTKIKFYEQKKRKILKRSKR